MTLVKICGITDIATASAALACGADMLGFHVELNHARNPVTPETADKIVSQLPETCTPVLVTSVAEPEKIIELVVKTGAKAVQLHAGVEGLRKIKSALPHLKLLQVINVFDESAVSEAKSFEGVADALVLDSGIKANGQQGGTGKTHDWSISKRIVASVSVPVILAGGLKPENVAEAIRTVKPYGVDVNSGVSNADGTKNFENVKLFVENAKKSGK